MNNQQAQFTTIYSKGILKAITCTPNPTFSHLLNVACSTIGAEHKEKSYLLKKVNFYKFRAYMEAKNGIHYNWPMWYSDNRATPAFNEAVADFINHTEKRTAYYVCEGGSKIDTLLAKAMKQTELMKSIIERM